jgi:hypothetical protein
MADPLDRASRNHQFDELLLRTATRPTSSVTVCDNLFIFVEIISD